MLSARGGDGSARSWAARGECSWPAATSDVYGVSGNELPTGLHARKRGVLVIPNL